MDAYLTKIHSSLVCRACNYRRIRANKSSSPRRQRSILTLELVETIIILSGTPAAWYNHDSHHAALVERGSCIHTQEYQLAPTTVKKKPGKRFVVNYAQLLLSLPLSMRAAVSSISLANSLAQVSPISIQQLRHVYRIRVLEYMYIHSLVHVAAFFARVFYCIAHAQKIILTCRSLTAYHPVMPKKGTRLYRSQALYEHP